ncbi:unnamed protein product [Cunninghamella blakesleeana]
MSTTISNNEFQFPAIYNFPPFYTRQPTETTWQNQLTQWSNLILKYTRHNKIYTLNLIKLSLETLQEIIEYMIEQGTARWDDDKSQVLLFWRKPDDWADLITQWVNRSGLNNDIVTVYEIAHGELSEGQEFYEIDNKVLLVALQVLVKRGIAQLFKGTEDDDMGVKFFGVK